jgi:uncharacterized membrane protein YraQ (UPF0718 family)
MDGLTAVFSAWLAGLFLMLCLCGVMGEKKRKRAK